MSEPFEAETIDGERYIDHNCRKQDTYRWAGNVAYYRFGVRTGWWAEWASDDYPIFFCPYCGIHLSGAYRKWRTQPKEGE